MVPWCLTPAGQWYGEAVAEAPHHLSKPLRTACRPAPRPIVKPGEPVTLDEILARVPLADARLMEDVDEAQRGGDPVR